MNVSDFELIAEILESRSGLELPREKAYLLESRLNPVARKWDFRGFDELARAVRDNAKDALLNDIVQAMTVTDSYFYRDRKPFRQFADLAIPHLIKEKAGERGLRIWCAGCSSGQEAYSLAMLIKERDADLAGWNCEILGTDLSSEMLARAEQGLYSQLEVQRGLPIAQLVAHFEKQGERWRVGKAVRDLVKFQPFNLLDDLSALGRFDVIFCRNVLTHFGEKLRASTLSRIVDRLTPGGFLCLGLDESVGALSDRLELIPGTHGLFSALPQDAAEDARLAG